MGSQHETVFLARAAFDAGQELRGHLDHGAAALADGVGVDVVGEVIDGAAVAVRLSHPFLMRIKKSIACLRMS